MGERKVGFRVILYSFLPFIVAATSDMAFGNLQQIKGNISQYFIKIIL